MVGAGLRGAGRAGDGHKLMHPSEVGAGEVHVVGVRVLPALSAVGQYQ